MKTLLFLLALASPLLAEGKKFTLTARASEIDKLFAKVAALREELASHPARAVALAFLQS